MSNSTIGLEALSLLSLQSRVTNGITNHKMACYHPMYAYPAATRSGKQSIVEPDQTNRSDRSMVFSANKSYSGATATRISCGKCYGCLSSRGQQWGIRAALEASVTGQSCFVTLTYKLEHLPPMGSLDRNHLRNFNRRLAYEIGRPPRNMCCGEYGEHGRRPHYHLAYTDYEFPDLKYWRTGKSGFPIYRSELAEKIWPFGHVEIGSLTTKSAVYVGNYAAKAHGRPDSWYERFDLQTGDQLYRLVPVLDEDGEPTGETTTSYHVEREFFSMTRTKPGGIGSLWWERYKADAFPSDFLILNGERIPVPKYFKDKLREDGLLNEKLLVTAKRKQQAFDRIAREGIDHNSDARLAVREESARLRRKRKLELSEEV